MNLKQWKKDRREALLSLDEVKIREYCWKYGADLPSEPEAFWGGVHKARLACTDIPEPEKKVSRRWLREHGFSLTPF